MPGWLTEVLKLLGFASPFVYAAATYGVFHWLDKKASGPAKKALTARLQSQPPDKETLANYALEVFDRIYSKPLWHLRAFCRSAVITTALCAVVWFQSETFGPDIWMGKPDVILVLSSLAVNVGADYISLFLIRKLLTAAGRRPAVGLVISFIVGAIVVYIAWVLRASAYVFSTFDDPIDIINKYSVFGFPFLMALWELSAPALGVHLWLPLFALAIGLTQVCGWLFKAVGWMQWFLKQGQHHPFQAVGYVASVIVFVSSVIIEYVWR
jgi:hypothetical protein